VDRRFRTCADVEGHARAFFQRGDVRRDAVANVDEVARLLARTVDGHRLIGGHARGEHGDHRAFLTDPLPWPVDVGVAQDV